MLLDALSIVREDENNMVVIQSYLEKNDCYKESRTITVKGLILNSVGCPQPSAKVLCNNWNRPNKKMCVHALIDANDGKVYNTLPWNRRGWHSSGSANDTHIAVTMCESPMIRYTSADHFTVTGDKLKAIEAANRTYITAVELFGQLCVKYHLDPMSDILSRKEAADNGIASKASSPETIWGGLGLNYTMDAFRKDVRAEVAKITAASVTVSTDKEEKAKFIETPTTAKISDGKNETVELKDNSVSAKVIKVRIDIDNLRIRIAPGAAVTGKYTGKGVFEITEIQNGSGAAKGWGKLADGSGWIMLDYATIL